MCCDDRLKRQWKADIPQRFASTSLAPVEHKSSAAPNQPRETHQPLSTRIWWPFTSYIAKAASAGDLRALGVNRHGEGGTVIGKRWGRSYCGPRA